MNRRKARENAFVGGFELSFRSGELDQILQDSRECGEYEIDAFGEEILRLSVLHAEEADKLVSENLKGWQFERLPRTCQVILRLAVCEMLYGPKQDLDSVVINEAVELAKKFAGESDYQFINGVLGTVAREKHGENTSC
ncbi:MAG: transcription antitermination factor NusB [Oscillospiraceae bacterium]|nr:transcription antitermination factor NusB [Oscillospiraceae bacterium]